MKQRLFIILAIFFSCAVYAVNEQNLDEQQKAATIAYAKSKGFTPADPEVDAIVTKAVKNSGIQEKVVAAFQHEFNHISSCWGKLKGNPYYFIALKRSENKEQMEAHAYHECGHIALGHRGYLWRNFEDLFFREAMISAGLGLFSLFKTFKCSNNHIVLKCIKSGFVGYFTCSISFFILVNYYFFQCRNDEFAADQFMYEQLIKQQKIGAVCTMISDCLRMHELEKSAEFEKIAQKKDPWFATHPPHLERARQGLQILQEHGYNIAHLVENMPHDIDPGVAEHFKEQIKKTFS